MKRITTEEFIERARKVHGDYYIYDEVDMNNRDEKGRVPIICPIHGRFWHEKRATFLNWLVALNCYVIFRIVSFLISNHIIINEVNINGWVLC